MQIRRQRPEEAGAVADLVAAAFGDEGEKVAAVWSDVVDRGLARASLVVDDDGELIGHVGLSLAWLDARERLVDVLVLSPLSVRPDRQRRGRGRALVGAARLAAAELESPAVFLEGDPGYYGRLGFDRAGDHGFEAPSRRTPEPAFQVALLPAHEPWMTGRVVYRDVWWEHDAAGLRDPLLAQVERAFGD